MASLKHLLRCVFGLGISLLICAAIGYCTQARAEGLIVGLHLASVHTPARDGQNNTNTGVYVRDASGLTAGAYVNTQRRTSLYVGQQFDLGPIDVTVGIVSGYQRRCTDTQVQVDTMPAANRPGHIPAPPRPVYETRHECKGFARGYLTPMVVPSVALPFSVLSVTPRIWFMPSFGKQSSVMHLSAERVF
jgi:hypothetical protein